jgi:MYXO-CTERM domain-containing protein
MKVLSIVASLAALAGLVGACSSEPSAVKSSEDLGTQSEALTTACNTLTIGLPCDPDGPVGTLLECEGVCGVGKTGDPVCYKISAINIKNLDGRICGTQAGVGDSACARRCSGRSCLAVNAAAGAACRPTAGSSPCDGQCDGSAHCIAIDQACEFGRDEQLCKFKTCDFANAGTCVTQNLLAYTTCSNDSACELGICSGQGTCLPGNVKGCDDGNSCTDDDCDAQNGACIGTPNDANDCSDGNACTTGEYCSNGGCVPGTTPVDCDDDNACTADGCDQNTGCYHQQKNCSDDNACTIDSCNPADAQCSHAIIGCNDNDPCTVDDCSPVTGCTHAPKDCSDGNACTQDACSDGACVHADVACNDNDACTVDACDTATGCTVAPIPDCGGGGAGNGGSDAGGADGGGVPGVAGEGPSVGGAPSAAGADGNEAGVPSSAGEPAFAGAPNPGTAGDGGGAVSGSTSGGGTSTGATTSDGGDSEIVRIVNHSSSCGCRTVGAEPRSSSGLFLLAGAALAVSLRRRRRA